MKGRAKKYGSGIWRKRSYAFAAAVLILLAVLLLWNREEAEEVELLHGRSASVTVAIDPGHGGFDPGKVGVDGTLEKEINLSISLILKEILEKNGISVIMTRTEDKAVGQSDSGETKKLEDMKNRVAVINESNADLAVSIHQNSFTAESSKGAQVFYYPSSAEGERLAVLIQEKIKLSVEDDNHRLAKSNDSYYMLKKTTCPIVIVECGFLSNYAEAALLNEKEYQQKIAAGIAEGIGEFLSYSDGVVLSDDFN